MAGNDRTGPLNAILSAAGGSGDVADTGSGAGAGGLGGGAEIAGLDALSSAVDRPGPTPTAGGAGEIVDAGPAADPDANAPVADPLEADLLAVGRDQSSAVGRPGSTPTAGGPGKAQNPAPEAKTPAQALEDLVGPDPFAILYNGPTGFYGLDSGLETIEGLKEEFTTVARNLAHYYVKTDGMRGAPAANLAIKRLLPHYPELHGIIKVPPLPVERPRPPVEQAADQSLRALDEFETEQRRDRDADLRPRSAENLDRSRGSLGIPEDPATIRLKERKNDETRRSQAETQRSQNASEEFDIESETALREERLLIDVITNKARRMGEKLTPHGGVRLTRPKLAFALLDHLDDPDFEFVRRRLGIPESRLLAARLIRDAKPGEFTETFEFLRNSLKDISGRMADSALLFKYEDALAQIIGSPGLPNTNADGSPESRRDAVLQLLNHTAISEVRKGSTDRFPEGIVAPKQGRERDGFALKALKVIGTKPAEGRSEKLEEKIERLEQENSKILRDEIIRRARAGRP